MCTWEDLANASCSCFAVFVPINDGIMPALSDYGGGSFNPDSLPVSCSSPPGFHRLVQDSGFPDLDLITRCLVAVAHLRSIKTFPLRSNEIEAIEIHDLVPSSHEVAYKGLLRVVTCIDLRDGPELRVRAKDEVNSGAGPLDLPSRAIASLEHAFGCVGRLPCRAHVEQVDEEIMSQRFGLLGEDA